MAWVSSGFAVSPYRGSAGTCGARGWTNRRRTAYVAWGRQQTPSSVLPVQVIAVGLLEWDTASSKVALTSLLPFRGLLSHLGSAHTLTSDRRSDRSTLPSTEGPLPRYHLAPSRNEVAIVQPVLVKHLENDILTAVAFLPRWLLIGIRLSHVKW
ncbi:hypothetical protein EDB85DRAFT_1896168 [Lactarius pseudohatsudake]|nr:hypothetical protein EDB85DRAFT_1896168 [Lactarius pseudohatsudake]